MKEAEPDAGYSIFEDVLSLSECSVIANAFTGSKAKRAGARNLMSNRLVADLAFDPRLLQLAAEFLGTAASPFRATLFEKSSRTNWHVLWHQDRALPLSRRCDSSEWGPWTTKAGVLYALAPAWALERVVALRIHLDASTNENGPLRVIPHSHKAGVLSESDISHLMHRRAPDTCTVGQGGVLAMRPLLLHSSMKARSDEPRRVIHLEYTGKFNFGMGFRLCVA